MAPQAFVCTVYRDRDVPKWIMGPKLLETFPISLDLDDPRTVDRALLGAARRDMGDEADLDVYSMDIQRPDGGILRGWRYNSYEDDGGDAEVYYGNWEQSA